MDVTLRAKTGDCRILTGDRAALAGLCAGRRPVVVTDANVRRHHGAHFPDGEVVEIGTGEGAKTLDTVGSVYARFAAAGLGRDGLVLAIGGGIVCDVAAYAAATWLRGVDVGMVPTTVLAMADAGVGGKCGVNFRGLKNQIGVIRQPRFVLCDGRYLETLPEAEARNGLAEIVKAAAIADPELFGLLEAGRVDPVSRVGVGDAIERALAVKVRVVEVDELETGPRRLLNFGHTLGHAYEAVCGVRHGEGVAAGMVFAARLSERKGLLARGQAARLERVLAAHGLPTRLAAPADALLAAMAHDKKRAGDTIHLALLERLGAAVVAPVTLRELTEELAAQAP